MLIRKVLLATKMENSLDIYVYLSDAMNTKKAGGGKKFPCQIISLSSSKVFEHYSKRLTMLLPFVSNVKGVSQFSERLSSTKHRDRQKSPQKQSQLDLCHYASPVARLSL
jgi:hypothetical protein